MDIVLAGGGTGGHLFPGVAVAEELADRASGCRSVFVGSDREIESQILKSAGFNHIPLAVSPSSAFLRRPISSVIKNLRAYRSAGRVLDQLAPSVVVGLGGFASVPVVLAARRRKIPVVLLEQNAVLGRANHWLLAFATRICLTYPQTPISKRHQHKARLTGNPVRRSVLQSAEHTAGRQDRLKSLVILGGSQGAASVNEALISVLPRLKPELSGWRVVHQTGNRQFAMVQEAYARHEIAGEVSPFFSEMGSIYQQADLVVSRAGGTTLAELAVHGLPALLIPYAGSIRDHQQKNAECYAEAGGAIVLSQSADNEQTADEITRCLKRLLTDPEQRETMRSGMLTMARPRAAVVVADVIFETCGTRRINLMDAASRNFNLDRKSA